jgi:GNAT superfamily N-acetyltransferase
MNPLSEIAGVQYGLADPSDVDEMAALLSTAFSQGDPIALALGVTPVELEELMRLYCPKAVAARLSVVARSAETGEMIGALLTEDAGWASPSGIESVSRKFDPVLALLDQLYADDPQGTSPPQGTCLHLLWLGVARPFARRGVGQQLVASCLENGGRRGYRSAAVEASSCVSQHILRKQGFGERARGSYRDFRFQDKAAFASIEGHGGLLLMVKELA